MKSKSSKQSERGAIHVLVALLVIPLLACMALAVDGFLLITSNLQQNNNAEYAAIAALKEMRMQTRAGTPFGNRADIATQRATDVAGNKLNRYVGRRDVNAVQGKELLEKKAGEVRFGSFDTATGAFVVGATISVVDSSGAPASMYSAVEVKLNTQAKGTGRNTSIKTVFAGIMGARELGMRSVAYACYDPTKDTGSGNTSIFLCKPSTVVESPAPANVCDTNGDGHFTQSDLNAIPDLLNQFAGPSGFIDSTSPHYKKNLDINSDNKITLSDALPCLKQQTED